MTHAKGPAFSFPAAPDFDDAGACEVSIDELEFITGGSTQEPLSTPPDTDRTHELHTVARRLRRILSRS